jgi:hypothetical protein
MSVEKIQYIHHYLIKNIKFVIYSVNNKYIGIHEDLYLMNNIRVRTDETLEVTYAVSNDTNDIGSIINIEKITDDTTEDKTDIELNNIKQIKKFSWNPPDNYDGSTYRFNIGDESITADIRNKPYTIVDDFEYLTAETSVHSFGESPNGQKGWVINSGNAGGQDGTTGGGHSIFNPDSTNLIFSGGSRGSMFKEFENAKHVNSNFTISLDGTNSNGEIFYQFVNSETDNEILEIKLSDTGDSNDGYAEINGTTLGGDAGVDGNDHQFNLTFDWYNYVIGGTFSDETGHSEVISESFLNREEKFNRLFIWTNSDYGYLDNFELNI